MDAFQCISAIRSHIAATLIGQTEAVDGMLVGLLSGGHVLLEGLPGLAKTLAAKTLASAIGGTFSRVQFTPDLLPSDITGASVYRQETHSFEVKPGPIHANIVLADEVNRAPAKVQSALLEAMQERQVTIDGRSFPLPDPFLVIATQNPIEHSGTYPLPEAEKDRFLLQLLLEYPSREQERQILERHGIETATVAPAPVSLDDLKAARDEAAHVHIEPSIVEYLLDIVEATRPGHENALSLRQQEAHLPKERSFIEVGASPRASLAIHRASRAFALLDGRDYVAPRDVKRAALLALPHRIQTNFEAEASHITSRDIVRLLLDQILPP
ncbi:MAG: MoxR family ATPase [Victivallales bacterium]|nr:MoxR family ATPase [Victivallales bacterium]